MKKLLLLSLTGFIFIFNSCAPEFDIDTPDTNIQDEEITMNNLVVSSNFDWKTYNDVNLLLTGNANSVVKVVSPNGVVYQQAYLSKDDVYNMKLAVPAHETSVRVLFNDQDVTIDISSGNAQYTFE